MSVITEKKYTEDGFLIVSELSKCDLFEKDPTAPESCNKDCFYCRFSDFRKPDYIDALKITSQDKVLFSVCHNENNKKTEI